ncbi:MAG: hypothetical protein ACREVR_16890 [Burkholderiales bacterium]|jgi:hypothetical protein
MRLFLKALVATLFAGFVAGAYAQGDPAKCDKLTGAEKEKCLQDARR